MAEELSTAIPQSQASSTKKRASKNEKLCLEDYLHLVHSRQTLHLTMNQLHQVIRIHGFKKIHHAPKCTESAGASGGVAGSGGSAAVKGERERVGVCCGGAGGRGWGSRRAQLAGVLRDLRREDQHLRQPERVPCCLLRSEPLRQNHSLSQARKENRIDETRNLIPEAFSKDLKPSKMVLKRKRSNLRDSVASTLDSASLASC
ncbi:hypothetical protein JHK85_017128 [Glycine max]|nr:hypothetical protein JHK85_017128 [Glycine max]KAG5047330.1 hypothetical protein JHK86_016736 [Glycine max]